VENRAVCEIMWKNIVETGRPQMSIWRMRFACWIPQPTNTLLHYVTIIAFPLQQWLQEFASMLRYAYIACLVLNKVSVLHCQQFLSAFLKMTGRVEKHDMYTIDF
jgi:hypothetical protein